MDGLINKIKGIMENIAKNIDERLIINNITHLKGTLFYNIMTINGRGVVRKITVRLPKTAENTLIIIIDDDCETAFSVGRNGIIHYIEGENAVFELKEPIVFNKSFILKRRFEANNLEGNVIYTLSE